jgi:hypothetical protein
MERLYYLLKEENNLPIAYLCGSDKNTLSIVYTRSITNQESNKIKNLLANFDWSEQADNDWRLDMKKKEAISKISDWDAVEIIISRNYQRITLNSLTKIINKLNELIDSHNLLSINKIDKLPNLGEWQDFLTSIKTRIQLEVNPNI